VLGADIAETVAPALSALAAYPMAIRNPDVAWGYRNALWTMGTEGLEDTAQAFAPIHLLRSLIASGRTY